MSVPDHPPAGAGEAKVVKAGAGEAKVVKAGSKARARASTLDFRDRD